MILVGFLEMILPRLTLELHPRLTHLQLMPSAVDSLLILTCDAEVDYNACDTGRPVSQDPMKT